MKKIILRTILLVSVIFILYASISILAGYIYGVKNNRKDANTSRNTSVNTSYYADSTENELQSVLRKIAGTYELTENLGIYGIKTVYTVTINSNGSGKIVFDNGEMENFYSAHLSGSNKITFNGDYGGTTFTYDRYGIEDESVKKYLTEIGTPKYVMTKIR